MNPFQVWFNRLHRIFSLLVHRPWHVFIDWSGNVRASAGRDERVWPNGRAATRVIRMSDWRLAQAVIFSRCGANWHREGQYRTHDCNWERVVKSKTPELCRHLSVSFPRDFNPGCTMKKEWDCHLQMINRSLIRSVKSFSESRTLSDLYSIRMDRTEQR
jgi:hypothetical protein